MYELFSHKSKGLKVLFLSFYSLFPIVFLGISSNMTSEVSDVLGRFLELATNSAGSSGFLVTLICLCMITLALRFSAKRWVGLMIQLAILLVLSFAAKTLLKNVTESPRPYTELLAQQHIIETPSQFYDLTMLEKNNAIESVGGKVSEWRTKHWQGEKDYSFPSGHTLFVAICVAFFGGLFMEKRQYWLVTALLSWAGVVMFSRLWLGMHRPVDLIGSLAFGGLIYVLVPVFAGQKLDRLPGRFLN